MAVFGKVSGCLAPRDAIDNEFFRRPTKPKFTQSDCLVVDRRVVSSCVGRFASAHWHESATTSALASVAQSCCSRDVRGVT